MTRNPQPTNPRTPHRTQLPRRIPDTPPEADDMTPLEAYQAGYRAGWADGESEALEADERGTVRQ